MFLKIWHAYFDQVRSSNVFKHAIFSSMERLTRL